MPYLKTMKITCPEDENIDCPECSNHFVCWEYDTDEIEQLLVEKFEKLPMEEPNLERQFLCYYK